MVITKYFQVINLTIPSTWIALVIAFIVAYIIGRLKYGKKTALLLGDALFYFVIVWKLSVVLTDFKTILQFPLSIIYFNGGAIGVYLGLLAAGIYLYLQLKKNRMTHADFFDLFIASIIILSVYQILVALFNPSDLGIRLITVIGFLVFIIITLVLEQQFKVMPIGLAMLMVGVHLFLSVLQPVGLLQTSTIAAIIIGLFVTGIFMKSEKMEANY